MVHDINGEMINEPIKKPPLGLIPRNIAHEKWMGHRRVQIAEAILRLHSRRHDSDPDGVGRGVQRPIGRVRR